MGGEEGRRGGGYGCNPFQIPEYASWCVGMTWDEAVCRCPEGVVPACHNSTDSVTVAGPADSVDKFVAQLQAEGVFARVVNSSGVATHSYFMLHAAPALKLRLQHVCFASLIKQFALSVD